MKEEHINEIKAVIIFAFGIIFLASFVSFIPEDLSWYTSNPNVPAKNLIRITGAYAAGSLFFVFGYSAYALVAFLFFWSWNKFVSRELHFTFAKLISFLILNKLNNLTDLLIFDITTLSSCRLGITRLNKKHISFSKQALSTIHV